VTRKDYSHPLDLVLDRPIAFQRAFKAITGNTVAALFLSQAWYWSKRHDADNGWFYNTQEDWEDETGLTRYEQETARKVLRQLKILEEDRRGVPARLFYRLNKERIAQMLNFQIGETPQSGLQQPSNQDSGSSTHINKNTETAPEIATMQPEPAEKNMGANAPARALPALVQERVQAFPEDCREGAELMFKTFGLIPPERPAPTAKGGEFAKWINGLRELVALAAEYNTPIARAFELVHAQWNRATFNVSHPKALRQVMASALAARVSKPQKNSRDAAVPPSPLKNFQPRNTQP
jgi:hypothetical protein